MTQTAIDAFDAHVERWREAHAVPGLVLGVVVDGQLVHQLAYGETENGSPIDDRTVFRIGSISKTFVATLAALFADEGTVNLHAPVASYLPAMGRVLYPRADSPPITLGHLLTHTAGLPPMNPGGYGVLNAAPDTATMFRTLDGLALLRDPGEHWSYSSFGIALAALALGRAEKRPFEALLNKRLLRPLDMTDTVWSEAEVASGTLAPAHNETPTQLGRDQHWRLGAGQPSGGMYSSLRDMSRWAAFHLTAHDPGRRGASAIVRPAALRDMLRSRAMVSFYARAEGDEIRGSSVTQGWGWVVLQDCRFERVVFHNGALEGYFASVYLLPDHGIGVIAMTNSRVNTSGLASAGLRAFVDGGGFAPRLPPAPAKLLQATQDALRLSHHWSDGEYERLYSPGFRSIAPASQWRPVMEKLRDRGGECKFVRVLSVETSFKARFLFRCRNGLVSAGGTIETDRAQFHQFGWKRVEADEVPSRCRVVPSKNP